MLKILEISAHLFLAISMLNIKVKKERFVMAIIISIITLEITKAVVPEYTVGFFNVSIFAILTTLLFKIPLWKGFVTYLATGLLIAITDITLVFISMIILGAKTLEETILINNTYTVLSLVLSLIVCLIGIIIRYTKRLKQLTEDNNKELKKLSLLMNNGITFLLLLPNLIMLSYYYDKKTLPFGILFINICSIIILFFVNMHNTNTTIKLAKSEQDLIAQKNYSRSQQDLIDGLRTFKHDYSNTLQTMYGYVQFNKMEELKKMFTQVLDETKAITTLDRLNPNTIKDPGLFAILNGKYQTAKDKHIKMEIEIFGDIEKSSMEIFDLTRVLGILLDNAIDAAKESKKKKIKFLLSERRDAIDIEISNTYFGKKIDLEKIKQKGVSSKGRDRGLGLYKVEEIVNKYESVRNDTIIEGQMFVQILQIDKVPELVNV